MAVKVSTRVRHNGIYFMPGDVIERISNEEAKRLVDGGDAFFVESFRIPQVDDSEKGDQESAKNEAPDNSFEGIALEDLKEAAKEVGITFNANIGFEKLVERIKEEGKMEEVLSQFEDGEE